jgi:hypothetical protein
MSPGRPRLARARYPSDQVRPADAGITAAQLHRLREEFQPCLPTAIEHGLIAREAMNVNDANATIAQWKKG